MQPFNIDSLAWEKMAGLIPAIIQDAKTSAVLMLGFMDKAALQQTLATQLVTFFSRSKNRLWVKGEVSGNTLKLMHITADCDQDTLLVLAEPHGPTCHTGATTCFGDIPQTDWAFIENLQATIAQRQTTGDEKSYTTTLFHAGTSKIAQKVGEEAVEVALASLDKNDPEFCGEVADLLFHLLVLLRARGLSLSDTIAVLKQRSK